VPQGRKKKKKKKGERILTANKVPFNVVSFYVAIFGKDTTAFNEGLLCSRQY
jgi:hypothetical protein